MTNDDFLENWQRTHQRAAAKPAQPRQKKQKKQKKLKNHPPIVPFRPVSLALLITGRTV
jgi:hypothetical protein